MKVEIKYTKCDVCMGEVYGNEHTAITFYRDKKEFTFDTCYKCLRGDSMSNVYNKILSMLRITKQKENKDEKASTDRRK